MAACVPLNCAPRRILPPPMTSPISQPLSAACFTCRAICVTSSMPMPRSPAWLKLSPESFRMTRAYGAVLVMSVLELILPEFPVHELLYFHPVPFGMLADGNTVFLHKRLFE